MAAAPLAAVFAIVGRRIALAFGAVVFLVVFLIAALQVASRHALKEYVEDQLARLPWDVSVYQATDFDAAERVRAAIAAVPHVGSVEDLHFLRAMVPTSTVALVDGEPLRSPWLSLLTATTPALLPPEARPRAGGAVLVLVGSHAQMGDAFTRLQGHKRLALTSERGHHGSITAFEVAIERVVRMERAELNRWFMEQTSSPTLVPELGLVIAVDRQPRAARAFDAVARGLAHVHEHPAAGATRLGPADEVHGDAGQYFPDIIHVVRHDRAAIVDGWDPEASRERASALAERIRAAAQSVSFRVGLDDNAGVLLQRMAATARKVGLISLLAAIPLGWMAWVLMATIATLLLLNGRRLWGVLRLRGAPARLIGAALLAGVGAGAAAGAIAGAVLGVAAPLAWFGAQPLTVSRAMHIVDARFVALAAAIGVAIALWASARLVRFGLRVSPAEAAARVSDAERLHARVRFGAPHALLLAIGLAKLVEWIAAGNGADLHLPRWWLPVDRVLDFAAYPLLVYGITTLLASRVDWLERLLRPLALVFGRRMATLSLRHFAARPHRAAAVMLVVALAASLALYPVVLTAVFDDKIARAAHAQLGNALDVTLNAPDLAPAGTLARGALGARAPALAAALRDLRARLEALPQVQSTGFLAEALVDGIYIEGQGFNSTPLFLVEPDYVERFHHEEALAAGDRFESGFRLLRKESVLASSALADAFGARAGDLVPTGRAAEGAMTYAPAAGALRLLPGAPSAAPSSRDSFSSVRVDYLNHLFDRRAYLVAAADNAKLAPVDALVARVVVSIRPKPGVSVAALRAAALAQLPARPLEVRDLQGEIDRLGSDMYVFLARENVRLYLAGGLAMTLLGLVAVALANFAEDRRTLALLRVRGARRRDVLGFLAAGLTAPALAAIFIGAPIALAVGFGMTHVIWELRELKTVLTYLPAHVVVSAEALWLAAALCLAVIAIAAAIGHWIFRRSARAALAEH